MAELLTTSRNITEDPHFSDYVRYTEGTATTSVSKMLPKYVCTFRPGQCSSDASEGLITSRLFKIHEPIAAEANRASERLFVSDCQLQFLRNITKELSQLAEPLRNSPAAKLLKEFCEKFAVVIAGKPDIRWAIYDDDDVKDGLEFMIHARTARRQVSFEFNTDRAEITIVKIDQHMLRTETKCQLEHENTLWNALAWLKPF